MILKKITDFLFSTRLMAVLFIVFAAGMAVGTFIENSYSTAFARIYVYNAKWFEAVMILLTLNFIGNISKYKLWRKEKWLTLLFHASFILILIGAGVTRYISYEGVMPIREGESSNVIMSQKTFLTAYIDGEYDGKMLRKEKDFHVLLADGANNHHYFYTDFKGQEVSLEITKFIKDAKRTVVADSTGKRYLKIVEAGSGQRKDHYIAEGQVSNFYNILFAFNKPTDGAINIHLDDQGNYTINTPFEGTYLRMADQKTGLVAKDSVQPLQLRSLYSLAGLRFVLPEPAIKGHFDVVKEENPNPQSVDAVFVTVRSNGEEKQLKLLGSQGIISEFSDTELAGLDIHLRYGSKEYKLPFNIHLNDFIAKKYPGTANNPTPSYSSFMSKVTVEDGDKHSDHDIYMNHVLDYGGFRFFQSSFMPDEKGTILSVSHDWWGTNITYVGYTLLYISMLLILFIKGSRFKELEVKLRKVKAKKKQNRAKLLGALTLLFALSGFSSFAQNAADTINNEATEVAIDTNASVAQNAEASQHSQIIGADLSVDHINKLIIENAVPKKQAAAFGKLVMQDYKGRMKPLNTYSSELLRKISRQTSYLGLNSDQVMLSMLTHPALWFNVPVIKIKSQDEKLRDILEVPDGTDHVKMTRFFNPDGTYKFAPYLEEAYRAKRKSQFQKDLVDTDGKVNLLYNALQGKVLRIFPVPGSIDNKWVSLPDAKESPEKFNGKDSLFVMNALPIYIQSLKLGHTSGDYTRANSVLQSINVYQHKFGKQVMPSDNRIEAEIIYNKYNIFESLFEYYTYISLFLFIFVILEIFYSKKWIHYTINFGKAIVILLFLLHTAGLIVRWYVSGHAPWGDAYESMIYVAWATMLFGLIFGRKSDLTIASTAFVTAIILMIAHWNWMDPSIAHLAPVLDSYWIMIHTSIIVASYGPFTLGAILGIVSLLLIIMTTKNNKAKMELNIKELTIITEMAITVGLVLLTIGNFLGGQWANESWGRYWSWDPKETWALISIMVYAFVIHMRLVPGLRSRFAFNWIAIIAFSSIMFTYFGVNFYLSGLHSYASGEQIISYKFIVIGLLSWFLLGAVAYWKHKKYYKKSVSKQIKK